MKWEKQSGRGDSVPLALPPLPSQKFAELWKVIFATLLMITMMLALTWTKTCCKKLCYGLTRNIGLEKNCQILQWILSFSLHKNISEKKECIYAIETYELVAKEKIDVREFDNMTLQLQQKLLILEWQNSLID